MALIDIDRHIATEIQGLLNRIKKNSLEFWEAKEMIKQCRDKTEAKLFTDTHCEKKQDFVEIRNAIYKATAKLDVQSLKIGADINKIDALFSHIMNRVEEFDTGKGTEAETVIHREKMKEEDGSNK